MLFLQAQRCKVPVCNYQKGDVRITKTCSLSDTVLLYLQSKYCFIANRTNIEKLCLKFSLNQNKINGVLCSLSVTLTALQLMDILHQDSFPL